MKVAQPMKYAAPMQKWWDINMRPLIDGTPVTKISVRDESKTVHLTSCKQYSSGVFTKEIKLEPKVTTILSVPYWHLEGEI